MGGPAIRETGFTVSGSSVRVSALRLEPRDARYVYVMAHGAGAGMRHPFMQELAERLAEHGIATFRYQFPYMEAGRRRPDPRHLLEATVRSAVAAASRELEGLPAFAGGKSMGGRMTSGAAAGSGLPGVRGLAFVGFPLHPPGKPGDARAEHLYGIDRPMLFLQGGRDAFARLDLLLPVCERLGARAVLHVVEGADHSFKVPKRWGRTVEDVMAELAATMGAWAESALA